MLFELLSGDNVEQGIEAFKAKFKFAPTKMYSFKNKFYIDTGMKSEDA